MNVLSDEEKKPSEPEQTVPDTEETPEEVSAFKNAWEMQAQQQREAELRERKRQAAAEEAAYHAREEYARELQEEKVELMRLKQGVITESDKVFPEQEPEKKYTLGEKIGNWLYHSKWWLGIAAFAVFIVGFLIYDYVTREDPDLRILQISENNDIYRHMPELTGWAAEHCEDYNGNGIVEVGLVYVPVSGDAMDSGTSDAESTNTQLMVQFQTATCMLVIADEASEHYLTPDGYGSEIFTDLSALYPDCDAIDGYKLMLKDTAFAEKLGLTEPLSEDTYLALRIPSTNMESLEKNQLAYDRAKALLDQLMPELLRKETE